VKSKSKGESINFKNLLQITSCLWSVCDLLGFDAVSRVPKYQTIGLSPQALRWRYALSFLCPGG